MCTFPIAVHFKHKTKYAAVKRATRDTSHKVNKQCLQWLIKALKITGVDSMRGAAGIHHKKAAQMHFYTKHNFL